MDNFKILLKKNLIEMVRNKKIIIFSLVFIALSIISALTAKFIPMLIDLLMNELGGGMDSIGTIFMLKGNVADSYVQLISNFGEIGMLLVGIMFATTITKEKNKGTYASLKMNQVKDHEIVLSHLVAQILLVLVSYMLSVAVFVILNILLFNQIMGIRGFVALTYIFVLLLVTICFSLLSSCLSNSSGKAYLLVILSYFGLGILEMIPKINRINPFHLITMSSNLMYYKEYSLGEHLATFFISIVFCVLFVIISLLVVKNKINNKVIKNDNSGRI